MWSKHKHVKICALMFWGESLLYFDSNTLNGSSHFLKRLQTAAGIFGEIIFSITHFCVSECDSLLIPLHPKAAVDKER